MNIKTRQEPVHVMEFSTKELEDIHDFLGYVKRIVRDQHNIPGEGTIEDFYFKIAGVL